MRKEYLPAMVLYSLAFLSIVASVVCFFLKTGYFSWILALGVALWLFASANLTKVGRKIRLDEENEEKEEKEELQNL